MKKNCLYLFFCVILSTHFLSCKQGSSSQSEEDLGDTVIVVYSEPKYDDARQSFYFRVDSVKFTGHADSIVYKLYEGNALIQQNNTGEFTDITPSECYELQVEVQIGQELKTSERLLLKDFVLRVTITEPLSKTTLEKLINEKDASLSLGENPNLGDYEIKLVGSTKTATTLQDVIQKLKGREWESVKVEDLSYDDMNRITSITIRPIGEFQDEDDDDY